MQDANFHNAWGPSESTCAAGLAQLCDSACAGKQVDTTAQNQCFSDINTQACSTVADGTLGNSCAQVCVDMPTGGGGNSGGGAGGSTGGGISDPIVFCKMTFDAICTRMFQCVPPAMQDSTFVSNFGSSVGACKTMFEAVCINPQSNCPTYSPSLGANCVSTLNTEACSDLVFSGEPVLPTTCSTACGMQP